MAHEELLRAIKLLAQRCDWANAQDMQGFNSYDAPFGHQLASQSNLSNAQAVKAYKNFAKYKKQLERMNFDWSSIPEPKPELVANPNTVDFLDGKYIVVFKFNYDLKDEVANISGAWYSGAKSWMVPLSSYAQLKVVADKYDFQWLTDVIYEGDVELRPQRYIDLENDLFIIKSEKNYEVNTALRALVGRKWNPELVAWTVPFASSGQVKDFAEKYGFVFAPHILEKIEDQIKINSESLAASFAQEVRGDWSVDVLITPRPYQLAGAQYLSEKKRAIMACDMGTGKSGQSIMAVKHEGAFPCLVVCPASVKINWSREIKMWLGYDSVILSGRPTSKNLDDLIVLLDSQKVRSNSMTGEQWVLMDSLNESEFGSLVGHPNLDIVKIRSSLGDHAKLVDNPKFVIVNYDIAPQWVPILEKIGFQSLICDESARIKNSRAKRSKAVKKLSAHIPYRFLLSGTPMLSRPSELINQLEVIDRMVEMGGFPFFTKRWCAGYHDNWGYNISGASNTAELGEKLRSICMIRRTKADVLTELPEKQRSYVYLPLSNRSEYNKAEKDIVRWVGEQAEKDITFRQSITHLTPEEQSYLIREYSQSAEEKAARAEHLVKIEKLKTLSALGKMDAVKDWIESFLETGEKLIVFGWHKEIVKAIANQFNAPSITGDTSIAKRQEYIDSFQNDDSCKLIVLNILAGGVGITLTASSNVAFVEQGWTPGEMQQAEDRCITEGQLVRTLEKGLVPIEQVQVGDKVLTHEGRWQSVLRTKVRQNRGMETNISYQRYHVPLSCTHDHRILIQRKGEMEAHWIEAHDVLPGDFVLMPKIESTTKESQTFDISQFSELYSSFVNLGGYTYNQTEEKFIKNLVVSVQTSLCKYTRVYDLEVEEDHSFVIGSAIVHNCHRIGQKNAVNCWYFLGERTIDVDISDLLQIKSRTITEIVSGEHIGADEVGIMSELIERLKQRSSDV